MKLVIHFAVAKGLSAPAHGAGKSGKHTIGATSLCCNTRITLELKDRIDLKWKKALAHALRGKQFRHDTPAIVRTNEGMFNMRACRDAKTFSNNLANAIIITRKGREVNKHGVTKETILKITK